MLPVNLRTDSYDIMRNGVIATVLAAASAALGKSSCQHDALRFGTAESVGMLSKPLEDMVANLTHFTEARNWGTNKQVVPIEPGKPGRVIAVSVC